MGLPRPSPRRSPDGPQAVAKLAEPGPLAQLGERRLDKPEVAGSSPARPIQESPARVDGAFHVLGGLAPDQGFELLRAALDVAAF